MRGPALASITRTIDDQVIKKGMRWLLALGLAPHAFALLETTGRRTGRARYTPVGNGLVGSTFWLVAARGDTADYVKNLRAEPAVRLKIGHRWLSGTAEVLPDDDPDERLADILEHFGWLRRLDAAALAADIRSQHSTPRVVRIHLTTAHGGPAPAPAASAVDPEELPFIDEHSLRIAADTEAVWHATIRVLRRSLSGAGAELVARLLDCTPSAATEWSWPERGSSLAGFEVEATQPPDQITLTGRHRFSEYALTFRVDEPNAGTSRCRAESRARFPGPLGRLYRTAVIGSHGHRILMRKMLRDIRRLAEGAPAHDPRAICWRSPPGS